MDRIRDILLYFSAAMAIFSLIGAVYQGMNERNVSAGVLASIFLACVFVVFLPKLEVLEAFGVKAHLVRTLNEADEILEKLKRVAIINAKAVYLNVGKGGRWGTPDVAEKQTMLDEIDTQLAALGVPEGERRSLGATYLKITGFDFYMFYVATLERYFQFKEQDLVRQLDKSPDNAELKEELARWRAGKPSFKPNPRLFSELESYSLEDEINRLSVGWLNEQERQAVRTFKNQIVVLFKSSQAKGGLTKEAAEYYDKYSDLEGQDKKLSELFGFNPSQPR